MEACSFCLWMLWIKCGYSAKSLCEAEKCAAGHHFVVFVAKK
ncbi:hypothetical protein HMPREF9061_01622 [Actinomyces sp. oral taxon 181 str. F0379]|nr:hypothetical protein HMPREF9061_01622 [Actinomyces sp. oral taxon 181 str. F0379]